MEYRPVVNTFSRIGLGLLFPVAILFRCLIWPSIAVFLYGWKNSPFWHNVKAGWLQSVDICFK